MCVLRELKGAGDWGGREGPVFFFTWSRPDRAAVSPPLPDPYLPTPLPFPPLSLRSPLPPRASPIGNIDPDNASILVAGGGGIALSVARRLKDAGAWVWMLQRSDVRRGEIEGMMAVVVKGDATVRADVDAAMAAIEEVDVVVSTIGGTPGDPSADSVGNINLVEAAVAKGVKKFVLVTSIGCGDSRDAPPAQVFDVLKPVLLEKDKAEAALRDATAKSGMAHVIVRPGGLTTDPPTGTAVLTRDARVCGAVSREDAAALVAKAALSGKAENVTLSVVDRGQMFKRDGKEPEFEDVVL